MPNLSQIIILLIVTLVLAFLIIYSTLPAPAQPTKACAPASVIVSHLHRTYRERPVMFGMLRNGHRFVMTASNTGTWTALVWRPNDIVCPVMGGTGYWQPREERRAHHAP